MGEGGGLRKLSFWKGLLTLQNVVTSLKGATQQFPSCYYKRRYNYPVTTTITTVFPRCYGPYWFV